jgi:hypothetical protein
MLLIAIGNAVIGFLTNKKFTLKDLRISLFAIVFSHLQLLMEIILCFTSIKGFKAIKANGTRLESADHLLTIEHLIVGILAIVFITIGWSKHKKQETGKRAYEKIILFYSTGLLLLLLRLPWKTWLNLY